MYRLTATTNGGLYPQVAIDAAGTIYVAFADGAGVYMQTSTDNGNHWSAAKTVASVTNPANLRLVSDTRPGYEGHLNVHVAEDDYAHVYGSFSPS